MKVITVSGLIAALFLQPATASICKKGACNADNCARAATGSFDGKQTARLSACSSFQQCTVIPATTTVTATFTAPAAAITQLATITTITQVEVISSTVTLGAQSPVKRDVQLYAGLPVDAIQARAVTPAPASTICPTAVPSSASACSGTSRYQSACSCAGVTKAYTTLSTPSTTITVTSAAEPSTLTVPVVASTTVTSLDIATVTPVVVAPKPSTFNLRIDFPLGSSAPAQYQGGQFVAMDNGFGETSNRPQSAAINFMINDNGELVNAGSTGAPQDHVAVAVTIRSWTFIVWDTRQHYTASHVSYPFTHCDLVPSTLSPGSYKAQCSTASGSTPSICDANQWNSMGGAGSRQDAYIVFISGDHAGCYPFELTAVSTS